MKWLKSKSFWGAVVLGATGVLRVVKPGWSEALDTIASLAAGLGIIGVAHKVEKSRRPPE